jgi:hypothetical protein
VSCLVGWRQPQVALVSVDSLGRPWRQKSLICENAENEKTRLQTRDLQAGLLAGFMKDSGPLDRPCRR